MPNGHGGVNWAGVFYVDPWEWGGAGPGFKHAQNGPGKDVAFSPYVCGGVTCYATITSVDGKGFLLSSATAASGYNKNPLVVLAYSHGQYVGTQTFMLTTDLQQLDFPPNGELSHRWSSRAPSLLRHDPRDSPLANPDEMLTGKRAGPGLVPPAHVEVS